MTHGLSCCIDKTSTAELSEAINSMFRWYRKAAICYAYIQVADTVDDLEKSRWFTRGWTLQELVAPHDVVFFSKSWVHLGRKLELKSVLWNITGIEPAVLESGTLSNVTVAKKMVGHLRRFYPVLDLEDHPPESNLESSLVWMPIDHEPTQSWAAKRKTTRVEDLAYCLLGIFDVNMPMLYGKGRKSFIRLQEEIMKSSYDHTLFAWSQGPATRTAEGFAREEATSPTSESTGLCGLLDESPVLFLHCNDIVPLEDNFQLGNDVTSGSGRIAIRLPAFRKGTQLFAALPCIAGSSYLALPLDSWHSDFVARRAEIVLAKANDLYIPSGKIDLKRFQVKPPMKEPMYAQPPPLNILFTAMITCQDQNAYHMRDVLCSPHATYDENTGRFSLTRGHKGLCVACLLEPKDEQIRPTDQETFFWKAAVLIGGDLTGDGMLWVAIVPVLPDTATDEAFHEIWRRHPALTTHCTTESTLVDQLASDTDVSMFSKIGNVRSKELMIHGEHWVEQYRREYDRSGHVRINAWKATFVKANIDVLHVHHAEKAFKISITFYDSKIGKPPWSRGPGVRVLPRDDIRK